MQPEREIKKRLLKLEIEARERRKITARNISIVIGLAVISAILTYSYPYFGFLILVDFLIYVVGVFGGIILIGIPILIHPLREEYRAFQKIAHATQVLEELKEPIAYEEAFRDVTKAYRILQRISLSKDVEWYKRINETLKEFFENLERIVLPAIEDSNIDSIMKVEHLKQIALAIYSLDPSKIDAVNKTLETEPSYKKVTIGIGEQKGEGIGYRALRLFRTNDVLRIGSVLSSSVAGCILFYYMLVNYVGIQKDYASGEAVALLIGLLTIYFLRPKRTNVQIVH